MLISKDFFFHFIVAITIKRSEKVSKKTHSVPLQASLFGENAKKLANQLS